MSFDLLVPVQLCKVNHGICQTSMGWTEPDSDRVTKIIRTLNYSFLGVSFSEVSRKVMICRPICQVVAINQGHCLQIVAETLTHNFSNQNTDLNHKYHMHS